LLVEYTQRLAGIVSPRFHTKAVLVVGTGAGSYAAEKLARFCPQGIKLCDFDTVAIPNLARTAFTYADAVAGKLKVEALAERIANISPLVEVTIFPRSVTALSRAELDAMFTGVDLVVAGTDNFEAQSLINKLAVRKAIPAVFIGIHANGQGGRVVWTVPGLTPCYRCVARERFEAAASPGAAGLDLDAARGSLVDCQFIDMVALKVSVAILDREQDSVMGRFFRRMGRRNDIVVRCDPEYAWGNVLWDALLGDLPTEPKDFARELRDVALLAMDTIWLPGSQDPNCPICGPIAPTFEVTV
jgi:molybdopterin/thiamine biosynthesis adenylyltransferase